MGVAGCFAGKETGALHKNISCHHDAGGLSTNTEVKPEDVHQNINTWSELVLPAV